MVGLTLSIGDSQHEFTRWFEDELPSFGISRTGLGEVKTLSRGRCVHTHPTCPASNQPGNLNIPLLSFVKLEPILGGQGKVEVP